MSALFREWARARISIRLEHFKRSISEEGEREVAPPRTGKDTDLTLAGVSNVLQRLLFTPPGLDDHYGRHRRVNDDEDRVRGWLDSMGTDFADDWGVEDEEGDFFDHTDSEEEAEDGWQDESALGLKGIPPSGVMVGIDANGKLRLIG